MVKLLGRLLISGQALFFQQVLQLIVMLMERLFIPR
jgi:hypothetical protein